MDQLSEVYGLKDSVILKLKEDFVITDTSTVDQINLAYASEESLRKHPYINYRMAKLLVAYRNQHPLDSISQIKEIKVMTDSIYQRMRPYLSLDNEPQ